MLTDSAGPAGVSRRIDAHHHLWDLTVRDQPWTAELPVLRRSFSFGDLLPSLDKAEIDGAVVVQTVAVGEETPELLAVAATEPRILGVVGWTDLTAPGVAEEIARLRELPGGENLVGIRHQVQGEADPEWLLRADVFRGLAAVADAGLVYELVVTHEQLPAAISAVERGPELSWVLDHAGKPPVASGQAEPWRRQVARLAAHDAVACKLSGLVTEAGDDWTPAELAPFADHVLASFGAERVMFGSDWPVCLLRTDYEGIANLAEQFVADLSDDERADFWGGTADRWYALNAR